MLGEKIEESRGKRLYRKVLPAPAGQLKVEVSAEGTGKLLGIDCQAFLTYSAESTPDGGLYGEGQGVYLTADGDMATWKGAGKGTLKAGGAVSYRGAIYFTTAAPKLARLNGIAGVFEFDVDASGATHGQTWEWK